MARDDREFRYTKGQAVPVLLTIVDNRDRGNQVCEVGGARFTASEQELERARIKSEDELATERADAEAPPQAG